MPDITMCNGEGCDLRTKCYRFTATPTPRWQPWFAKPPMTSPTECPHYWQVESKSQFKRLEVQTEAKSE